ncbi:MAG: DoxX family protein [Sphingomonas sp.]|uniref:DoxX family protein n=1 Tax=Sphingomonas sp. TaxID=28214 RepID=UPI0025E40137|nr:DoxX family protein [Sphingomonas sp.]MBX3565022.1 DoxX family protein [Sphingomonas sp.]
MQFSDRRLLGLTALRVAIACLLAIHGWYRFTQGGVTPFGEWLTGQGVPFGPAVAAGVTGWEILATPLLAIGWRAPWLCMVFAAIYAAGLVMVHWPEGWFVVGGGRNGMEYSVLLLVCLSVIGFTHWPEKTVMAGAE